MNKVLAIACSFALALGLIGFAGCASSNKAEEPATEQKDALIVGKVTAVEGSEVTLDLGELPQQPREGEEGTMPEPPAKPEGEGDGVAEPQQAGDMARMARPDDAETKPNESGNNDRMARPNGEEIDPDVMSDKSAGQDSAVEGEPVFINDQPAGFDFIPNGETATMNLENAHIESMDPNGGDLTVEDIQVGDILIIETDEEGNAVEVDVLAAASMGPNGAPGENAEVQQGTAATTLEEDGTFKDQTYASAGNDENALRVVGATVTLKDIVVNKDGGATSSPEQGDFYGMNAALLATDGAQVTIANATVTSNAQGGNGVFSYGNGTLVDISESTITTQADNSGGIQTTGGATTLAKNLTIQTAGASSAPIRSDRGGGTVMVTGGSYTSTGLNSPAIYSTADIVATDAKLKAENSEALVIEGKNSISLENCTVEGAMSKTDGASSAVNVHNVMIYQSMSGDAEVGTASFGMSGGKLTGNSGDLFFATNTEAIISLTDVKLVNKDQDGLLMRVTGNNAAMGWGQAGQNGAQVQLDCTHQTLEGAIEVDSISTLNLHLMDESVFTGTINVVENAEGGQAVENNAVVVINEGSVWNVTGDCTISKLENNGTIKLNGHKVTLADGTLVKEKK